MTESRSRPRPPSEFLADCRAPIADAKRDARAARRRRPGRARSTNTLEVFNERQRHRGNAAERWRACWHEVHPDRRSATPRAPASRRSRSSSSTLLLDRACLRRDQGGRRHEAPTPTPSACVALTLRDYQRAGRRPRRRQARAHQRDRRRDRPSSVRSSRRTSPRTRATSRSRIRRGSPACRRTGSPRTSPMRNGVDQDHDRLSRLHPVHRRTRTTTTSASSSTSSSAARGDAHNEECLGKLLVLRAEKAKLLGFKDWADYSQRRQDAEGRQGGGRVHRRASRSSRKPRAKRDYAELLEAAEEARSEGDGRRRLAEVVARDRGQEGEVRGRRGRGPQVLRLRHGARRAARHHVEDLRHPVQAGRERPHVVAPGRRRCSTSCAATRSSAGSTSTCIRATASSSTRRSSRSSTASTGKQLPEGALVCNLPDPKTSRGPGADGARRRRHDVPRVRPPHAPRARRPASLGARRRGVATEQDFVEAPSQMFEEWGWSYETLSRFAKNADTARRSRRSSSTRCARRDKFGLGTQTRAADVLRGDLARASTRPIRRSSTSSRLVKKLQAKYTPFAYVEGTKFHTSFGHLVGYSSMYYTYMWSLVIAKDMLTPFDKARPDGDRRDRQVSRQDPRRPAAPRTPPTSSRTSSAARTTSRRSRST